MKAFTRTNLLLLAAVVALVVSPVVRDAARERPGTFTGTDSLAQQSVAEDHPDYEPWFHPLYQPQSSEIEAGLFALQASLGAGFLGYYLGVARTRRRLTAADTTPSGRGTAGGTAAGDGNS